MVDRKYRRVILFLINYFYSNAFLIKINIKVLAYSILNVKNLNEIKYSYSKDS